MLKQTGFPNKLAEVADDAKAATEPDKSPNNSTVGKQVSLEGHQQINNKVKKE